MSISTSLSISSVSGLTNAALKIRLWSFHFSLFQAGPSNDNPAIHGLEMVLSEIRGLRDELREHKQKLSDLRHDVNMLLIKGNHHALEDGKHAKID